MPLEVCQEIECGGASDFGVAEFRKAKFIQKKSQNLNIALFLHNALDLGKAWGDENHPVLGSVLSSLICSEN